MHHRRQICAYKWNTNFNTQTNHFQYAYRDHCSGFAAAAVFGITGLAEGSHREKRSQWSKQNALQPTPLVNDI